MREWELGLDCGLPLCGRVTLSLADLSAARGTVQSRLADTHYAYKNTTRENKVCEAAPRRPVSNQTSADSKTHTRSVSGVRCTYKAKMKPCTLIPLRFRVLTKDKTGFRGSREEAVLPREVEAGHAPG